MTHLYRWLIPDRIFPMWYDALVIAIQVTVWTLDRAMRKVMGLVPGPLTDDEAAVVAALIVTGRKR